MTDVFNSQQCGLHLGVSDRTIRNLIARGEIQALSTDPIRVEAGHIAEVLAIRQAGALNELARRHQTPVDLAWEVRRSLLRQEAGVMLPGQRAESQRRRLGLLPDAAKSLFGQAALTAVFEKGGCRWCKAAEYAAKLPGYWAPAEYSEGFAALFGQDPCERCAPGLYAPVLASLRARVHPGGVRPSAARVVPSAAERERAAEWAQRHPVMAAARPVRDDGGRALVARRLREERARLKAAKRAGDQRLALRLAQVVRSLEADAAAVDGRAVVSRPGMLRCGHALAAGCSCPRRAPQRGQR